MPRIIGVDVPHNKPAWIALSYIHGIGRYSACKILQEAKVNPQVRAGQLTEDEISRITQIIDRDYLVEGQLRRKVSQDIARLKEIGCYRGVRHRRGLPVRGQQTQSNARTRKGRRKTVAGKKSVKEMR
ncbi:MAG TPA: 30S ribosomal protein S13 [Anaerohalosphaeraceae bacterium]|jgi:small subunit ribosomal protein S13|nr:30S ribosomal protein S13 [Phycisphaerae bacterium]HOM61064.1 30S ribosomal protein S13 [Anaerohalosphaeraceae bacterium]HOT71920.1 30S ribosomal protein S13 [Anaerohalosphaeraceae bacterium]HPB91985.1 30S ribosomal protein S13 [Anaerohalosphaeraceae bacterium]HQG05278.1 30S ribosomal protein S13 [Anaerohalosphaeraceae bacterium]